MSKENTGENNVELTNNLEERKENHIPDSNKEEDHKGRQKDHGIRSRMNSSGKLGASPSSLAALVKGKAYLIDPKTPFLPKPEGLQTRQLLVGTPSATLRSNHWITQTSPGYIPRRLQNHRIPRTPPEIKRGIPATPAPRASKADGSPAYIVDSNGYLKKPFRKEGRTAFREVERVGTASWAFTPMGYV